MKLRAIYLFLLILTLTSTLKAQAHHDCYSLLPNSKGETYFNGTENTYDGQLGDWILDKPWKYSTTDNIDQAKTDYDDSKWDTGVSPELMVAKLKPDVFKGLCWFRLKVFVDSTLRDVPYQFLFSSAGEYVTGAIEVYIDGNLAFSEGKVATSEQNEVTVPLKPHSVVFDKRPFHEIAIRFSDFEKLSHYKKDRAFNLIFGFQCELMREEPYLAEVTSKESSSTTHALIAAFYITVTLVHLMLFLFYRTMRSNLYYSLFTLSIGFALYLIYLQGQPLAYARSLFVNDAYHYVPDIAAFFLLAFYYSVFYTRMPKLLWYTLGLLVFYVGCEALIANSIIRAFIYAFFTTLFILFVFIESIRVVVVSIIQKRDGAWIIATGVGFILLFSVYIVALLIVDKGHVHFLDGGLGMVNSVLLIYCTISIPVSMSIYLARNFARTSRSLTLQLVHVKQLSQQNLQLIQGQKERLEVQVKEKTAEILKQKNALEQKNKEVTDSINYAKRIQTAILPKKAEIKNSLPNSFVLFKPKDIVSGDFYFFSENNGQMFLAAADCTGHGVPGAFMSMIGTGKLSDAVEQSNKPGEVLQLLNQGIKTSLHQSLDVESTRDGMDIALCSISKGGEKLQFTYSGANRPLWLIRKGSKNIEEIKATKKAIGGFTEEDQVFANHHIELNAGDTFYLFSDGYPDQFGGKKGKKLTTKFFKDMLLDMQDKSMHDQEKELEAFIEDWKGQEEQLDDILVIGVRI